MLKKNRKLPNRAPQGSNMVVDGRVMMVW